MRNLFAISKEFKKCLLVVMIFLIAVLMLPFITKETVVRLAISKYDKADHAALLQACREILVHRHSYKNSPNYRLPESWEGTTVTLKRDPMGFGTDIPKIIRELNPISIVIHDDSLIIYDPPIFPPMRRGIICFSPNAHSQYGTRQYLDGLWYWDGNFESPEMSNQVYGENEG